MIIAVCLAFAGIVVIEVPNMIKKKLWRELIVFIFLLLLAMIYSFGMLLNWQLPNIADGLKVLFGPVTQYFENLLS